MNFKVLESAKKLRGGYYTQSDIAKFLTQWILEIKPKRILEPSCGDGAFVQAIADLAPKDLREIVACEIVSSEAEKASSRFNVCPHVNLSIHIGDFLEWSLLRINEPPLFDGILGNPPFIRYQYLEPEQQNRSAKIFRHLGLPFTKHTNAWVPFILVSITQLRPLGRLAMVVPSEILHVLHAKPLRDFLLRECSRILILDPDHLWFSETLQGVVLLLAERKHVKSAELAEIAVVKLKGRDSLNGRASEYFAESEYLPASSMNGKWMLALLNSEERNLLRELSKHQFIKQFRDIATVDVGIVTGANKFFLVSDSIVKEFRLEQWAYPMFGRSEHVPGIIYDKNIHEENRQKGLPTNFLWFKDDLFENLSEDARLYIKRGENAKINERYKCRIRKPWYTVPSVYATPIGMLKRCHHFPRLLWNKINALTTDTAYRIQVKSLTEISFVVSFINSLTALTAELEGRHYGGGVLELVPSEIEKLLVPIGFFTDKNIIKLDKAIRNIAVPEDILEMQDMDVLMPLGLTKADCVVLRNAYTKLRLRRQRVSAENEYEKKEI